MIGVMLLALSGCSLWGEDDPKSPNSRPVAVAGTNQSVFTGEQVSLDGRASSDQDGNPLSYAWILASKPVGSLAEIVNAFSSMASLTPDVDGSYIVQLIVHDGKINSAASNLVVTAETTNRVPVANAGADQFVRTHETVNLDGSASFDPEGGTLTYSWILTDKPDGSSASIANATSATAYITPDVDGSYLVQLVVNDGMVAGVADAVVVSATSGNRAPLANAGPDQAVAPGVPVVLDGTASSDLDGNPLTYAWRLTVRPIDSTASIASATSAVASLTPDVEGNYTVQLIVDDGIVASTDTLVVTVSTANTIPVAVAGPDRSATINVPAVLDGSASYDRDGNPLTYLWRLTDKPFGSMTNIIDPASVIAAISPDRLGSYTVQLVVNDGTVDSVADTMVLTANNYAPVADAGNNQTVGTGSLVFLSGRSSYDLDDDPLTYAWSFVSVPDGSNAMIVGEASVNSSFVADVPGSYIVRLVVSDGKVNSEAYVTIDAPDFGPVG